MDRIKRKSAFLLFDNEIRRVFLMAFVDSESMHTVGAIELSCSYSKHGRWSTRINQSA